MCSSGGSSTVRKARNIGAAVGTVVSPGLGLVGGALAGAKVGQKVGQAQEAVKAIQKGPTMADIKINMPKETQAVTPETAQTEMQAARDQEMRKSRLAKGRQSTILTGALGLSEGAVSGKKTLLGQ